MMTIPAAPRIFRHTIFISSNEESLIGLFLEGHAGALHVDRHSRAVYIYKTRPNTTSNTSQPGILFFFLSFPFILYPINTSSLGTVVLVVFAVCESYQCGFSSPHEVLPKCLACATTTVHGAIVYH